jgi:hypothetical protein
MNIMEHVFTNLSGVGQSLTWPFDATKTCINDTYVAPASVHGRLSTVNLAFISRRDILKIMIKYGIVNT